MDCLPCRESRSASMIEPMICSHKSGEIASVSVVNGSSPSVLHTAGLLLPISYSKDAIQTWSVATPNACMLWEAHEYQVNGRACRKVILEIKRE